MPLLSQKPKIEKPSKPWFTRSKGCPSTSTQSNAQGTQAKDARQEVPFHGIASVKYIEVNAKSVLSEVGMSGNEVHRVRKKEAGSPQRSAGQGRKFIGYARKKQAHRRGRYVREGGSALAHLRRR